ncbi:hypothetical protein MTR67_051336 [Solanum verrucosum]|uniref:Uncharacterized protein n=1 Tax=Solanum verrucosum TaxID=315347 RepID=A0AAF0V724_SOLVR|nr:hypothetical protein MTR67_051336 [Solanum verrucosum]
MSPERKKLFLSQLRQKRAESKREKLLHQSNSTSALTISTSSVSPQQGQLTIFISSFCQISLLNIYTYTLQLTYSYYIYFADFVVQACKPTTLPVTSTRGERIVNCLSTFEVGSTSITSHVATKLTSTCTANKGMLLSTKLIKTHVFF